MARILSNIKSKIENKTDLYTLPYTKDTMKGLSSFINDVRHCKSRAAEIKRVNKELANIRSKFRADKNIDGYHKKKYIAKLVFIHLLGYEVNFGQSEAIYLLCSNKFSEKQIGYLFLSMLPDTDDDQFCKTMVSSISADLRSHNHNFVILAAHCVPNVLCREIISEIGNDLMDLLRGNNNDQITQSLLSCYLAMIQFDQQYFKQNQALNDYLLRLFVTANETILLPLANIFYLGSQTEPMIFSDAISGMLSQIQNLTRVRTPGKDHSYYGVQSPWTILKLMQCIQAFPTPQNCETQITEAVKSAILMAKTTDIDMKKIHEANICNALAFEAINVMSAKNLHVDCIHIAVQFLVAALLTPINNYRYFSMESMLKIKDLPNAIKLMTTVVPILMKIVTVETNTPLRLKAVDVMYAICEPQMLRSIVDTLMNFLKNCELNIKEELTLKISMMCIKVLNDDIHWFVDTMMRVVEYAGQDSSEDIWHKILHVITNNVGVQQYASVISVNYMKKTNSNDRLVMLSSYILGEFGDQLYHREDATAEIQTSLLLDFFPFVELSTKHIIMTALFKIANKSIDVRPLVLNFISSDIVTKNIDCEMQQRACEYAMVLKNFEHMLPIVLKTMPEYVIEEAIDTVDRSVIPDYPDKGIVYTNSLKKNSAGMYNMNCRIFEIPTDLIMCERPLRKSSFEYYPFTIHYEIVTAPPTGYTLIKVESTEDSYAHPQMLKVTPSEHNSLKMKGSTFADPDKLNWVKVEYTLKKDFTKPAMISLECFYNGERREIIMMVPVYIENFFVPYSATAGRFKSIWEGIGENREVSFTMSVEKPWNFQSLIEHCIKELDLQYVPDTSQNKDDRSYLAVLVTETDKIGCAFHFVAWESTSELSIMCRSADDELDSTMLNCLKLIFKKPKPTNRWAGML